MSRTPAASVSTALAFLLLATFDFAGCGSNSRACVPGDQTACACPGGKVGAQACNQDGSGYLPCDCSGQPGPGGGATCGNGVIDPGEECDDGNIVNGDGCNVRCDIEPNGPIAGGAPMGADSGSPNLPVAFAACNDENTTQPYAPGPNLPLRACAIRYVDAKGNGVSANAINQEFARAQTFHDVSGSQISFSLIHLDTVTVGGAETDPKGDAQLQALHTATRQRADAAHPSECDVVVGYANTLRASSGAIGGQATWPTQDLRECLVARGNVGTGETTAHEVGHVLGLYHTFETCCGDGDGCADTPVDTNCAPGGGCAVQCAPLSLSHNVMSYFLCGTPFANGFSACQIRRSRCFLSKIFSAACGDATYCNGHGSCSNSVCTCSAGYTGARCDSCAPGYNGYPACVQNCPANFCNGHGTCANNACACNAGYAGAKCDSCANGYVGYPNCVQNCPANFCNGHGTCANNACACNAGYAGAKCDSCANGYVGYPNCVQNCPANFCNGHGTCANNACACNAGYGGAKCDACAMGFSGYPNCAQFGWFDQSTGLLWQKVASPMAYSYANAGAYCAGLMLGGLGGWRLPTINELRSIIRGCPATMPGGACSATNSCTAANCWTNVCLAPCTSGKGPNGGCYLAGELTPGPQGCGSAPSSTSYANQANHYEVEFGLGSVTTGPNNSCCGPVRCVR